MFPPVKWGWWHLKLGVTNSDADRGLAGKTKRCEMARCRGEEGARGGGHGRHVPCLPGAAPGQDLPVAM